MSKSCLNCLYNIQTDYGYSNYTVEGTNVYCLKNAHPKYEYDRWYGENEEVKFAELCGYYKEGDPVYIDADEEDYDRKAVRKGEQTYGEALADAYGTTDEVKELMVKFFD